MNYQHQEFPAYRYGPDGASVIVNSEDETPKGYVDHPSKVKGAAAPAEGTKTAVAPANSTTSAAKAAKTTTAKSQTVTPPEVAAKTDPIGNSAGNAQDSGASKTPASTSDESKGADPSKITLDADGHPYDPTLHAGTGSKTKAGLWRMKVGVRRPDPAPGYPLDL